MIRTAILAVMTLLALSLNAEARQRHRAIVASDQCNLTGSNAMPCEGVAPSPRGERIVKAMGGFGSAQKVYKPRQSAIESRQRVAEVSPTIVAHPTGCPSRSFCGCGAAVRVFGAPIRSLWLAANWFKFPRSAPAAGMVAVRRHHVFVLEADLGGGLWMVYDANSGGHATRIHARSIAGYQIVNPHGGGAA